MLPTLTIPSVPRPPCSGEQAGAAATDSEGGDAFADALQRAQGEPRAAHAHEPRQQAAKPADAHGRARPAQAKGAAHESTEQAPASDSVSDAAALTMTLDATAVDAAPRAADAGERTTPLPAPAAAVIDPSMTPQTTVEAHRNMPPCVADPDDSALAMDSRDKRPASRIVTNDVRAARPSQGQIASPADPSAARDAAAALPLRTAPERASNDVVAAPLGALHAPSFERSPIEATPSMLAGAMLARDGAAAATAAGTESKLPQATLHAAIDQPGFGAAVGSQVAMWVRDGVQEARLQLHPAELGPVTVQITLDGQAAHVDFTAAVAATRESIEQSLPALAAALRESGFTLAGGGVSSDSGQAGHDTKRERTRIGHGGDRSRSEAAIDGGHAVSALRHWTRSLLDVYA